MQPTPLIPHVTVSGYNTCEQVSSVLAHIDRGHLVPSTAHVLGVGVHVRRSAKGKTRGTTGACLNRAHLHNTIHFFDPDGRATATDLQKAVSLGGEYVHALQLHHPWHDIPHVCHALYRNRSGEHRRHPVKIAWRMDLETFGRQLHRNPQWLVDVLRQRYGLNTIDWITFDVGDGSRIAEYRETLHECYRAIRSVFPLERLGVAVAADLAPGAAELLVKLFAHEDTAATISYTAVARGTMTSVRALESAVHFYEDIFHLLGWRSA